MPKKYLHALGLAGSDVRAGAANVVEGQVNALGDILAVAKLVQEANKDNAVLGAGLHARNHELEAFQVHGVQINGRLEQEVKRTDAREGSF